MFLLFLTHKYLQHKSEAPQPRRASIYTPAFYSQWAPLSIVPNFCGFWPESFCGSAAIMCNPNLETKLFLSLTRRAWAPAAAAPSRGCGQGAAGQPQTGMGHSGRDGDDARPADSSAGKRAPSAHVLHASSVGCSDHPRRDSRDQERSPHWQSLELLVRRECTRIDIYIYTHMFVLTYLFNCSWASSSCAQANDSSLFLCRGNIKMLEKECVAPSIISLDYFLPQVPCTIIISYFCT